MRKRVALLAAAGLGLTAITLALGSGPRPSPPVVPRAPRNTPTPGAAGMASLPVLDLARSPFEYAGGREAAPAPVVPGERDLELSKAEASLPLPEPVRLVGFVERAGKSRVALVIHGEMALLEVGESAEGFALLAADEETGVRLRGPDGAEIALGPEP